MSKKTYWHQYPKEKPSYGGCYRVYLINEGKIYKSESTWFPQLNMFFVETDRYVVAWAESRKSVQKERSLMSENKTNIEWHPYPQEKPSNGIKLAKVTNTLTNKVDVRRYLAVRGRFYSEDCTHIIAWAEPSESYKDEKQ